jgi:hypothetical protein
MHIEKPIGKYSKDKARRNLKKGLPIVVISYVFFFITGLDYLPIYVYLGRLALAVDFLAGIAFMYGAMQFIVPFQQWRSGSNGEKKVADNISDKLGSEHFLFNDVMLKDGQRAGNIDHIIVGPRGIFAIETKNIQKKVTVIGDNWGLSRSPSQQAKKHAGRIYRLLNNSNILERQIPYVKAIVVWANGKTQPEINKTPELCKIISVKDQDDTSLRDFILEQDLVFSTKEIEKIVDFLNEKIVYD